MKVLVVSGFLGAGKTTFIKKMLEVTKKSLVILENEYGSVGLDGQFLNEGKTSDKINIWELTEGCICCSVKSDFATSVLTIANTLDPEYLIVEPTGVGMLSAVLQNIRRIEYERISLLQPLTIIDATCFDADRVRYGDIYIDQIHHAARILFSKTERVDVAEQTAIMDAIAALNPDAILENEHYACKTIDWWMSLLETRIDGSRIRKAKTPEVPDLENLAVSDIELPTIGTLVFFLERIVHGFFGEIRRAKGCVKIGDKCVRFDVVDKDYCITGFEENQKTKAVFIGRKLARDAIKKTVMVSNLAGYARFHSESIPMK